MSVLSRKGQLAVSGVVVGLLVTGWVHSLKPIKQVKFVNVNVADSILENHKIESILSCGHRVWCAGIHNEAELQAALRDSKFKSLYAGINFSHFKFTTLAGGHWVYMSYRIGDKLYFTKKPVFVADGTPVLTDGETYILERCGNMFVLDQTDAQEIADDEPLLEEQDNNETDIPDGPDYVVSQAIASLPNDSSTNPYVPNAPIYPTIYGSVGQVLTPTPEIGTIWDVLAGLAIYVMFFLLPAYFIERKHDSTKHQ